MGMRKTEMNIDFYSDTLESDIALLISVDYEVTISGGGASDEGEFRQAWFDSSDVSILNTKLDNRIALEFFNEFEDYVDVIGDKIESDLNN